MPVALINRLLSRPRLGAGVLDADRRRRAGLLTAALVCAMVGAAAGAAFSAECKPHHFRPAFFVNSMGACAFDAQTLGFAGDPVEQAKCLMRGMDATRNLAPAAADLPQALASRIGQDTGLPSRETLSAFLSGENLEWDFAAYLWQPVARARDDDADAPLARYFVIHDTSGPNYGHRSFPGDLDVSSKINNLGNFRCSDGWGKAHVVVNRSGAMLVNHDFATPWRETRFEQAANFAGALKGLFLHVELVQPRRSQAGRGRRNDAQSPDPGFTAAQYDRLALLYVIASVRAEHWLVPAFHAAIDSGLRNGHDDPLGFEIASFADSLNRLIDKLQRPEQITAAIAAAAAAPDASAAPRSSAMPAAETAETGSLAGTAIVKADAVAQPWAGNTANPPRQHEASRERKSDPPHAAARHCQTRIAQGHRWRVCRFAVAGARERATHGVRSMGRRVWHQGAGARYHVGNIRTRHERPKARHYRA